MNENRAQITFLADVRWPRLIRKASVAAGIPSNNRYIQEAVMEKMAKDLEMDIDVLRAQLLPTREDYPSLSERRRAKQNSSDKLSKAP